MSTRPRVLVLQHAAGEGPGSIEDALALRGVELVVVHAADGEPVPNELDDVRGLVLLGGEMAVYESDRFPFLKREIELAAQATRANLPVLGICLGSQILASALGARVAPTGTIELGWHDVRRLEDATSDPLLGVMPDALSVFHWHGDAFEIPRGAVRLASSAITANQAFRFGERAWGLQFHLEVRARELRAMLDGDAGDLARARTSKSAVLADAERHLAPMIEVARAVFSAFAEEVRWCS